MMQDGECWELTTLEDSISESDFSLWATPIERDWKDSPGMATETEDRKRLDTLPRQVFAFWPTPVVACAKGGQVTRGGSRSNELLLGGAVRLVSMWPTPDAYPRGGPVDPIARKNAGRQVNLQDAVTLWPTVTVHGNTNHKGTEVMNAFGPTPSSSDAKTAKSGPLNPEFAEWLMNWVRGWTSMEALSPNKFYEWFNHSIGREETGASSIPGESMRAVRFTEASPAPPQRHEPHEQQPSEHSDTVSKVPHCGTHGEQHMGIGKHAQGKSMCGLPKDVSAEEVNECPLREDDLCADLRSDEGEDSLAGPLEGARVPELWKDVRLRSGEADNVRSILWQQIGLVEKGPWKGAILVQCQDKKWRAIHPEIEGMAKNVPHRIARISAVGDGQVPAVVAAAFQILTDTKKL